MGSVARQQGAREHPADLLARVAPLMSRAEARQALAAPELADALADMIDLAEWLHNAMPKHRETIGCPDTHKRLAAARAALAKAGVLQ